jgi:hypothetical protein
MVGVVVIMIKKLKGSWSNTIFEGFCSRTRIHHRPVATVK